jgi:hypothetical protein
VIPTIGTSGCRLGLDCRFRGSHSSDPSVEDGNKRPLVYFGSLTIAEKRHVHQAMELLDSHQYVQRATPKPPLPESIEDLPNPDFPLKPAEPGASEIPPRRRELRFRNSAIGSLPGMGHRR